MSSLFVECVDHIINTSASSVYARLNAINPKGVVPVSLRLLSCFDATNPKGVVPFPQQRKLTGSSAQNSSGVQWCRRWVRFNRKFRRRSGKLWRRARSGSRKLWCKTKSGSTGFRRRFPEKVWVALVQSQVRFDRVPEKVPELWCWAKSGSTGSGEGCGEGLVRFNRVPEKVPEKVLGGFGAEPGQVQQGSGEGSGGGLGGFGAEQGQVQQGSGEGSGEGSGGRLWCRARSSSTAFRRKFRRRFRRRSGRLWCKATSGSTGFWRRFRRSGSTGFRRSFQRRFRRSCFFFFCFYAFAHCIHVKIKRCGCWGYHRSLFVCRLLAGAMDVSVCIILGSFQICHCKSSFWHRPMLSARKNNKQRNSDRSRGHLTGKCHWANPID